MKMLYSAVLIGFGVFAVLVALAGSTAAAMEDARSDACALDWACVPTEVPASEPENWIRYDVPLEDELQRYIYDLCQRYEVDMPLVLAVIDQESDFQADKLGDGGHSYGLMQIYQEWHMERIQRLDAPNLFNPYHNVRVGVDYLAELIGEGKGTAWALSFYNGHGGALPWWYVDEVQARAAEIKGTAEYIAK